MKYKWGNYVASGMLVKKALVLRTIIKKIQQIPI